MAEVSRTVRERLSQQAAGEHPDANLLSAFAEHSLNDAERAQVLDHLSRCAECREVAALALPAVEEEQLAAAVREPIGASRSRWRSPFVHWGALTAAALVVLIAVGERMKLREGHSASAPAIATSSSNEAVEKSAGETSQVPALSGELKKQSGTMAEIPAALSPAEKHRAGGAAGTAGGKAAELNRAPVTTAKKIAPSAPPPGALLMKPNESATSKNQTLTFQKDGQFDQVQAQAATPPPSVGTRDRLALGNAVGGTSQAAPATENQVVIAGQPPPPVNFVRRALPSPRWSVSDSGVVQRSLDGGRTWKEVAVADGIVFRAVAVLVNDIWAGGSGGALFHSADGGQHWLPVPVRLNGRSLSGDIVRLDFAGASNVVVTSSTGEVWTTSDGGAHWRVQ
jgi:Photosynthesis system II assembly factor YCF48/Putative zinc-finger